MKQNNVLPRAGRGMAIAAVVASAAILAGCAHDTASSSVYTYGQAQREQVVRLGTVQSVRPVTIQPERTSGAGVVGGAALGGVAGSAVGGGRGQVLATIGGGLLGAYAGDRVEKYARTTRGLDNTVMLVPGQTIVSDQAD